MMHTCNMGNILRHHRAKPDFAHEYQHMWRHTLEQYPGLELDMTVSGWRDCADEDTKRKLDEWGAHYMAQMGGILYGRSSLNMVRKSLYLTEKGYIGMGPPAMGPGDVIVVYSQERESRSPSS